ncbi:hypothetical protein OXX79_008858 [Metschnikowia pulcherrima]
MSDNSNSAAADDFQNAKNALVSSLCELSTAATQTATAALNFYKFADAHGAEAQSAGSSLKKLGDTVLAAAKSATTTLSNGTTAEAKKTPAKQVKKKDTAAPPATPVEKPAPVPAPAPAPKAAAESAPESASKSDDDVLAKTDPALKPAVEKVEKVRKKRAEKDPNAPKKPVTSYLRFNLAVREELRRQRNENGQPTLQATELNQIIAERWATLGEPEKSKLQKAYESEYEVYKKAFDEYKTKKQAESIAPSESSEPAPTSEPAEVVEPSSPAVTTASEPAASEPVSVPTEATPASPVDKPKKKKKAPKKTAELSEVEAVAAAATEAAKAAIAAEVAQNQAKPSKKRKDKESSEKQFKKKKSESSA